VLQTISYLPPTCLVGFAALQTSIHDRYVRSILIEKPGSLGPVCLSVIST